MIIRIERSGGVTGIPLRTEIDTRKLPQGESEALGRMVEQAGFFNLPAQITSQAKGADRFQYQLTVEEGARRHTVSLGESGAPPALQTLIQQVTQLARK